MNDRQRDVLSAVHDFVSNEIEPEANYRNHHGIFSDEIYRKLVQYHYHSLIIDRSYDGASLDLVSAMLILNRIAYSDASLAHLLETNNFGFYLPVQIFGTEQQKETYLLKAARSGEIGTIAFTEAEKTPSTVAVKCGNGYKINGSKTMVTCADIAKYALLYCKLDEQDAMFIIDLKSPGIAIGKNEHTMGLNSIHIADLTITDLELTEAELLSAPGKGQEIIKRSMEIMRISNAAVALGIAQRAFDEALSYAKLRRMDDTVTLFDMQAVKYELAVLKAELDMLHTETFNTAHLFDCRIDQQMLFSSITKYVVTEKAKEIVDKSFQYFGGSAYIKGTTIERSYRDIRIFTIIGGVSEMLKWSISRYL
ncbi:acyl-CoA dehydrogenase family protein [Paenibacillus sophorae]|nr:acyl-CoA dehydrogenase family protein [Paenibacillus sophorae]QWU13750.1 acyl-CoA/acyl-ACP dehydrogenase [Paenibacillus sophorae]